MFILLTVKRSSANWSNQASPRRPYSWNHVSYHRKDSSRHAAATRIRLLLCRRRERDDSRVPDESKIRGLETRCADCRCGVSVLHGAVPGPTRSLCDPHGIVWQGHQPGGGLFAQRPLGQSEADQPPTHAWQGFVLSRCRRHGQDAPRGKLSHWRYWLRAVEEKRFARPNGIALPAPPISGSTR